MYDRNVSLPNFSVLIPVYFKEDPIWFDAALESVVNQSLMPDEVVIVEDGSLTEELYKVIIKYKKTYNNIFTILSLPKNMGMGYAMDFGLQRCKNEYIARMDTDDISHRDRFLYQMTYLVQHPEVDVIGSYIEEFKCEPGDMKRYRKVPIEHFGIVKYAKSRCPINHMTVMFKKSQVIAAGSYWHKKAFEDYNLWYKMIKRENIFYNLPIPLVYARVGNNMVTRRKGKEYFESELLFFKSMRSDGFITSLQFYAVIAARWATRHLPIPIIRIVYDKILRQRGK